MPLLRCTLDFSRFRDLSRGSVSRVGSFHRYDRYRLALAARRPG
jgi:hypothetical protein